MKIPKTSQIESALWLPILINGITGKMGIEIKKYWDERGYAVLGGANSSANSLENVVKHCLKKDRTITPIIVDVTSGEGFMAAVYVAAEYGLPIVSGSSGIVEKDYEEIKKIIEGKNIVVAHIPNFSLSAVKKIRQIVYFVKNNHEYSVAGIKEEHHLYKKDKISGTAMHIVKKMIETRGKSFDYDRETTMEKQIHEIVKGYEERGMVRVNKKVIGGIEVYGIRRKDVVANHEVMLKNIRTGEHVSFKHTTESRYAFMDGVRVVVRGVKELYEQGKSGLVVGLDNFLKN